MQVETLLAIGAVPIPHKKITLRHLPQVILMQELAMLALLAQPTQPMLAHERVQSSRRPAAATTELRVGDVAFMAARAVWTVSCVEGAAYRAVGRETDLFLAAEEGGEAEVVGLGGVVEDVGGEL